MVYEEIIQKFESDIRMHLRHQNFLKLHIDTLQHTLELNNKEIKTLKETFETTKEIKDKMERVHHKELADVKAQESQLSQKVIGLKDKITELSMYITTNNAPTTHTLDKRDPLYSTIT
jgi:chromosome segregation ATPase